MLAVRFVQLVSRLGAIASVCPSLNQALSSYGSTGFDVYRRTSAVERAVAVRLGEVQGKVAG
jgi:hypothetical protein